jgi:hypothetical protein
VKSNKLLLASVTRMVLLTILKKLKQKEKEMRLLMLSVFPSIVCY